jgi:hypothetical protein
MVKNEMLASWVYKNGELAKQRFMEKTGVIAMITGLVLFIAVMYPLILWDTIVFNKITGWIILIALFAIVGLVYYLLQFFSGILFSICKKIIRVKAEEVVVTSAKIITEKKTWILRDETHLLTTVAFDNKIKPAELLFKGKQVEAGMAEKFFTVKLPVPEDAGGEKIYNYFKKLLEAEALPRATTL